MYSGDGLVVTHVDGSITWEKDGKTGFIYENPGVTEDVEGKVDWDWDGSRLGLYSQSDGRFVMFDTMDLPFVGQPWQLHLWDSATPEQPPKQIASVPAQEKYSPEFPAIRGHWLLWNQPAPDTNERQVMLYDLTAGEKRVLLQGYYYRASFVTDDLVMFVEQSADEGGTLGGIYISSGERWQAPAALKEFRLTQSGFVSDGSTTAIAYDPLTGDTGGYGVAVWREGWSKAMTDESYLQAYLGDSVTDAQLQGDLLTYTLSTEDGSSVRVWNLRTGVIYEIYKEYGVASFEGEELVLGANPNKTLVGESARIPLSDFENGECPA